MAGSIDIIAQSFSSLRSLSGYAKRWRGSGHGDYRSRWKSGFLSCGRFTDTDVPRAQNYYRTNELTGRSGMNPNVSHNRVGGAKIAIPTRRRAAGCYFRVVFWLECFSPPPTFGGRRARKARRVTLSV